jgi:hypothetical protein
MYRFIRFVILAALLTGGCKSRSSSGSSGVKTEHCPYCSGNEGGHTNGDQSSDRQVAAAMTDCLKGQDKARCDRFAQSVRDCQVYVHDYVDPYVQSLPEGNRASKKEALTAQCCSFTGDPHCVETVGAD